MAINTTFTTGQVLTATQVNNLPFGLAAASTATAGTAVVGGTALSVLTATFTVVPNRRYLITGRLCFQPLSAASGIKALYLTATGLTTTTIYYETTSIGQFLCGTAQGFAYFTAADFGVTTGSGTSKTVTMNFKMAATGQLNADPDAYVGANSFPQQLIVQDIGAA
jgi:hypothetical protein